MPAAAVLIFDFNSNMVRLKVYTYADTYTAAATFQFQYGAIKSYI